MARITIKDIARESGYSIGTVSRALNNIPGVSEQAREVILKVVEKHNFKLNPNAKYLKQKTKEGIAIFIRGLENVLFADLLERIQAEAEKAGYETSVHYLGEDEDVVAAAVNLLTQRSMQGILFLGSARENFRHGFDKIRIPSLMVTNSATGLPYNNLSSVSTNDAEAAQFAVEYLFSLGHENIGVLGGWLDRSQPAKSRYQGVQYAYFNRGLRFDPTAQYEADYFSMEGGYRSMERLLKKNPDVSAIFCMSDVMAMGAMRAAADHGMHVPEDLSVIGFDGVLMTQYTIPRLTTIQQDTDAMSKRTVEILLDMIENGAGSVNEEIPFALKAGESVGRLQSSGHALPLEAEEIQDL